MGKPRAPKPPDPQQTAAASTGTAVNTAIANTQMGNVSQSTPFGSQTYSQSGSSTFTDPFTGMSYDIPQFTSTTTLSPEQQRLYDQSVAAQTSLGQAGLTAARGFTPTQAGVPTYDQFRTSAGLRTNAGLDTNFGANDFSADRDEYEAALMARMRPSLDRSQEALNASLANQGLGYGAEAFNDAQFTESQRRNDAEMAAILAGGTEQQRMFEMDMAARAASNAARQQEYMNFNNPTQQEFQNFNSGTQANNATASTAFGQSMQSQNDYMNQIMTLLGASQPNVPQFTPNRPSPIPTTDTAGIINTNYGQQQGNYQQQMAQWNSMWGNLFGLGGDIVGAR
jgi:hypothetical protein